MSTRFWDAFWAGLACPTRLYASGDREKYSQTGRVDVAWQKVGGYIYDSIDAVTGDIDHRGGGKPAK